ncbi:MAG: LacI family transcriptional regulator [Muribaculaceae bacterium]|nr:LacI family transcriptional regulator [Muribaculaceae bacterium]
MKRVSLKDIAQATNLSKTTVSFILNGKGEENNISKEAIAKVLATACRLGYRPNFVAKSLLSGKSNMIGLIVPRITDTFFAQIASEVEREAALHGYTVVYGSSEEQAERERKLIDTFIGKQIDGLIIASSMHNEDDIKRLHEEHYPFVLIDRHYPSVEASHVIVENETASHRLVETLIDKGYRRIALITISPHLNLMKARAKGYAHALEKHGIDPARTPVKVVEPGDMDNAVRDIIKELLAAPKGVDAIYFTTHYLASLGFKHLRDMHVSIPRDIAVCCFGDSPYLELFEPPITAIPMPARQMGKEATRILLAQISDNTTPAEQIELPLHIEERKSW